METPLKPPQPEKYPPVVYKYRNWKNDYHKRILLNLEIFLSSPSYFNDPYDCKIPIAYWKLAEDAQLAMTYFSEVVKRNFPPSEYLVQVENLKKDRRFSDPLWNEKQELDFYNCIAKDYGIISLTEFKDDIQMWSHYSNSHTGFCIGFKSEKLFFNNHRFGSGGKVDYVSKFPIILPTDDPFEQIVKVLYTKCEKWRYEQEYRLTKIYASNKTVAFSSDEVEEIIIGCSTSNSDIKAILNVCKSNLPGIPVLKAKQKRNDFKITLDRLQ